MHLLQLNSIPRPLRSLRSLALRPLVRCFLVRRLDSFHLLCEPTSLLFADCRLPVVQHMVSEAEGYGLKL